MRRTKCQVQRRAYWPGWSDTIVSVLRKCALCACRRGHVSEAEKSKSKRGKNDKRSSSAEKGHRKRTANDTKVPKSEEAKVVEESGQTRGREGAGALGGAMTAPYWWAPPPLGWGRPEASASVAPPPPWGWSPSPMPWGPMAWSFPPFSCQQPPSGPFWCPQPGPQPTWEQQLPPAAGPSSSPDQPETDQQ